MVIIPTRIRMLIIPRIRISEERFVIEEDKIPPLLIKAFELLSAIFFVLLNKVVENFCANITVGNFYVNEIFEIN